MLLNYNHWKCRENFLNANVPVVVVVVVVMPASMCKVDIRISLKHEWIKEISLQSDYKIK